MTQICVMTAPALSAELAAHMAVQARLVEQASRTTPTAGQIARAAERYAGLPRAAERAAPMAVRVAAMGPMVERAAAMAARAAGMMPMVERAAATHRRIAELAPRFGWPASISDGGSPPVPFLPPAAGSDRPNNSQTAIRGDSK